jgi:uncharacterized membrane protein YgcG
MPFVLIIVGIVLLVAAVRNTVAAPASPNLATLIKGDFTGQDNFAYWLVSILVIGALGYVPELKPLSRAFLVLVIIVLFLSNGGFFSKFNQQAFGGSEPSNSGFTGFGGGQSGGGGAGGSW